ncbi:acyl-CoA thioesterase [Novosphingobium huizhouense]|uniref:acyl-CoA thioesterase n=1 Tax=Novosphingobium huizhouense TaxID=2866625 RepID=UPI001CD8EDFB|nr:acyl-CoA thioesterase II [Novosphingobium huizhouense]
MSNESTATPSPEELVADLLDLLNVEDRGGDRFRGKRKRGGVGRVFGGQVIGQALASAELTVPADRPVHSLHAYFVRGGNEDYEIDFRVERDLDGGSFSNRRIVASQQGQTILNMLASFHKREDGAHHAQPMPQIAGPEGLANEATLRREAAVAAGRTPRGPARPRPIELRPLDPLHWMQEDARPPVSNVWFRAAAPLPDDPKIHRAVLAYASDMTLLSTCVLPHAELSWAKGTIMSASLDHAIWFHDDFRADEWLLYTCESNWAGRARGFNNGRIYTQDGRLVANVTQEGLIRPITPKPRA